MEIQKSGDFPSPALKAANTQKLMYTSSAQPQQSDEAAFAMPPKDSLADILRLFGMKPSTENIDMLKTLITNNYPLNRETVLKMNQAMRLTEDARKSLFLLSEGIPVNTKNAGAVKLLTLEEGKLSNQILNIIKHIEMIPEQNLKDRIVGLFLNDEDSVLDPKTAQPLTPEEPVQTNGSHPKTISDTASSTERFSIMRMRHEMPSENESKEVKQSPAEIKQEPDIPVAIRKFPTPDLIHDAEFKQILDNASPNMKLILRVMLNERKHMSLRSLDTASAFAESEQDAKLLDFIKASVNSYSKSMEKSEDGSVRLGRKLMADLRQLLNEHGPEQMTFHAQRVNAKPDMVKTMMTKLLLPDLIDNPSELDNYFQSMCEKLAAIREALNGSGIPQAHRVAEEVSRLSDSIDFMAQMRSSTYIQIPLIIDERALNAEILVFGGKRKQKSGSASALIALDTANLGRFEAYIQKNGISVTCQFRIENEYIERLARSHIHKLIENLNSKWYRLDSFSFHKIEEPFSILDAGIEPKSAYSTDNEIASFDSHI